MLKGSLIYLVLILWVNDGEDGVITRAFENKEDAKKYMKTMYDVDLANYKKRWEEMDIDFAISEDNAYMNPKERYCECHITYEIQQKIIN